MDQRSNFQIWHDEQTRPARLLLIEDCAEDIILFKRYSINHHCDILTTTTGDEALRRIDTEPFRIAFMDWKLSGPIQGVNLLRALKEHKRIPTVIISGYIDTDMAHSISVVGFAVMIQKPTCYTQEFFDEMLALFNIPKIK